MTLDLDGRTVLPGLVMLHEHMGQPTNAGVSFPQPFSALRLYLDLDVVDVANVLVWCPANHLQIVFSNGVAHDPQTLLSSVKGQVG